MAISALKLFSNQIHMKIVKSRGLNDTFHMPILVYNKNVKDTEFSCL